ncbi:MAG: YbgC/FadM family acyl-CoA thioesterase [Firmicutes bacterium]|nr:YbgC/FadM family acyl-CoA thioesterase [Bacillota bacterium]
MTKSTEHSFTYRVYVEDTDLLGIVYHANHLRFFERARTELLRANGLSLTTMAGYNTHFAIHDVHIRYLYPARLDDILTIKTNYERHKTCSLLFKQTMHNQLNQLLCEATIQIVCVNEHLKPKPIPNELAL